MYIVHNEQSPVFYSSSNYSNMSLTPHVPKCHAMAISLILSNFDKKKVSMDGGIPRIVSAQNIWKADWKGKPREHILK